MRYLGKTAKELRKKHSLSQKELSDILEISVVHLSNIENSKVMPSPAILSKYREEFGCDLYVLDWCNDPDVESLPEPVRNAAQNLKELWKVL